MVSFSPSSIQADEYRNIFVVDTTGHKIITVENNGAVSTLAGMNKNGLNMNVNLISMVINTNGDVIFIDRSTIRAILVNGTVLTVCGKYVGYDGEPIISNGYSGDGGLAIYAQLNYPQSIFVHSNGSNGEIYIADSGNNRIRKIDSKGIITTIAGTGLNGYVGDGGLAIYAQLNYPGSVFVHSNGEVYIADTLNSRIRKIDSKGIITTIAGTGAQGYSGDGGMATRAQLNYPVSVFVHSNGEIYIADTDNNRIRKIDLTGTISPSFQTLLFSR